ncbi:DUF4296 domain-containing protein [Corallibacter sp.]|uniref:DUF4296 domain-containing protein n=1 Tax=Corallibacter sp. TaxID=2038084 RepID=UPI003AB4A4FF
MKNVIRLFVILVLISACKGIDKPDKPDNLLSKQEMVNVLIDLSLISSAKGVNKKTLENSLVSPKAFIYKKHHIDSLQFALSNQYYAYNSEVYSEILNQVSDSLNILKEIYQELENEELMKKVEEDSIKGKKLGDSLKLAKHKNKKKKPAKIL